MGEVSGLGNYLDSAFGGHDANLIRDKAIELDATIKRSQGAILYFECKAAEKNL